MRAITAGHSRSVVEPTLELAAIIPSSTGRSEGGADGTQCIRAYVATTLPSESLHMHLTSGVSTNSSRKRSSIACGSAALLRHDPDSSRPHGFAPPIMVCSPRHADCALSPTLLLSAGRCSYVAVRNVRHISDIVSSAPRSTDSRSRSRPADPNSLAPNLAKPVAAAIAPSPPAGTPGCWIIAHAPASSDGIGVVSRVMTEPGVIWNMLRVSRPYSPSPCSTSCSGEISGLPVASSCALSMSARNTGIPQKIPVASSTLSKKSSRPNSPSPHPSSTLCPRLFSGHAPCVCCHMATTPAEYSTPPSTLDAACTLATTSSVVSVPRCGRLGPVMHCPAVTDTGTSLCHIAPRCICIVCGFSQYVA